MLFQRPVQSGHSRPPLSLPTQPQGTTPAGCSCHSSADPASGGTTPAGCSCHSSADPASGSRHPAQSYRYPSIPTHSQRPHCCDRTTRSLRADTDKLSKLTVWKSSQIRSISRHSHSAWRDKARSLQRTTLSRCDHSAAAALR